MRRLALTAILATLGWAAASVAAQSAFAATLCVGPGPGCYSTIQAALNAANDGDTISVPSGTFAGGLTIDKSIHLVGAGAASTTIDGGGPVIAIGSDGSGPTVSINGVSVTGGRNSSNPGPSFAAGGGVKIEAGASVTIADSAVSGNAVAPETTFPDPAQACGETPHDRCAFAAGGGIDNSGTLVLTDTQVAENVSGSIPGLAPVASNADGGGIASHFPGTLVLRNSAVTGNRAVVGLPNGRFSDGGGISSGGVLKLQDSVVSGNSSDADAAVPSSFFSGDTQQETNAGGIYLPEGSSTTIIRSTISGNSVTGSNTVGDANAEAGGIDADGVLLLNDSVVSGNHVSAYAPSGTLALAIEGGLQVQGSLVAHGSRISDNSVVATSIGWFAGASGGGLDNLARATLEDTTVSGNRVTANGPFGAAQGGGVSNFTLDPNNPPTLKMLNSSITGNTVQASPGITPEGGGLWNDAQLLLVGTAITGNSPDQCFGC
jgi:hypothetical protein